MLNRRQMLPSSELKIAYTVGEPAGIGPDIILQLMQTHELDDVVVVGDREALQARADALKLTLKKNLAIEHIPVKNPSVQGAPDVTNVQGVLRMLDCAIDGCMSGEFASMVTGPLHKGVINDAGYAFSGHTEYLAEKTGAELPVMLLATEALRVALVTTHLPLRDVADAISEELVIKICRTVHEDFQQKYGIQNPKMLVCGLNPHAGEGGHLGSEEIQIIEPALSQLRSAGLDVVGPLPADTLFTPKYLSAADVCIAMYHDQGLPVLKSQGFGEAANITLGLPIIRTSVDHGTAFDLAGSGEVDIGSLKTAITVARQMVAAQNA